MERHWRRPGGPGRGGSERALGGLLAVSLKMLNCTTIRLDSTVGRKGQGFV